MLDLDRDPLSIPELSSLYDEAGLWRRHHGGVMLDGSRVVLQPELLLGMQVVLRRLSCGGRGSWAGYRQLACPLLPFH